MTSADTVGAADLEALFLANLPVIDRIVAVLGARYGLDGSETEEFGAWAREHFITSGYAPLRRFGGRSSLQTYLSVVLANLFKDYRNSRWGRWRPSASARRLGPVAIRLENLIRRDGLSLDTAVETLREAGVGDRELRGMAAQIPHRSPTREVALEGAATSPSPDQSDAPLQQTDANAESARDDRAIADALAGLPDEDRVIIRMRYWDDCSVAEIARALGLEQKPLYRRIERIQAGLAAALAARGVDRQRIEARLAAAGDHP